MPKINVSVVSYSNSIPFVYGLLHSEVINDINLSLDIPATCADKVLNGTADVGLMPIVETLRLPSFNIASDMCIGAVSEVRTVILASDVPVHELSEVYLDYQSRTSVTLVRVLAKYFWKINPKWIPASQGFETKAISGNCGAVIIGDRAFAAKSKYRYDLAQEWIKFTGLPFVFAAWIANKELGEEFRTRFNKALSLGLQNLEASANLFYETHQTEADILDYLQHNISYTFDAPKRQAMELFLNYAREILAV